MMPANIARTRDRDDVFADDLGRRARQHQRAIAERDRFGDIVGDEHDGLACQDSTAAADRPAIACASARRARRTVRPSGSPADRRRACGSAKRACACRRTVHADSTVRSRRDRRRGSTCRPARAPRHRAGPALQAETARSATSCATAADCPPASRSRCGTTGRG